MSQDLLDYCMTGDLSQVQLLLTDKTKLVDIHYQDNIEINALMYAAGSGHLNIVKYLLTSETLIEHANMYDKDKYGNNALTYTCKYGHLEISQYLIIEQNMIIDNNTMNWLIKEDKQEVLKMIQTRDLYQKMNNDLSTNDKMIKQRKI